MNDLRTVTDGDNVVWTCVQAYAGLTESRRTDADAVLATEEGVAVVCTPNGGAQSVRVELRASWAQDLSDNDLLASIERARSAK